MAHRSRRTERVPSGKMPPMKPLAFRRIWRTLGAAALCALLLNAASASGAGGDTRSDEAAFLDDVQRRAFLYFWERADPRTGLVADRAGADGGPSSNARSRHVASIAATGFGLAGVCVAERRGWVAHDEAY